LYKVAAQARRGFKTSTFVLASVTQPQTIMGYHSLTHYEYRDGELDASTTRALKVAGIQRFTMILLAQLGVSSTLQNCGLGKMLLWDAFERSYSSSVQTGGVAIITDPIDVDADRFYGKFFEVLHRNPTVRMMISM
jgi:hypothetical protein